MWIKAFGLIKGVIALIGNKNKANWSALTVAASGVGFFPAVKHLRLQTSEFLFANPDIMEVVNSLLGMIPADYNMACLATDPALTTALLVYIMGCAGVSWVGGLFIPNITLTEEGKVTTVKQAVIVQKKEGPVTTVVSPPKPQRKPKDK